MTTQLIREIQNKNRTIQECRENFFMDIIDNFTRNVSDYDNKWMIWESSDYSLMFHLCIDAKSLKVKQNAIYLKLKRRNYTGESIFNLIQDMRNFQPYNSDINIVDDDIIIVFEKANQN